MTKYSWDNIRKDVTGDKNKWNKMLFKKIVTDLGEATWRIVYNNGSHVEGPDGYPEIKRTGIKSASVVINGKALYTMQIVNDKMGITRRNLARPFDPDLNFPFDAPKRAFIIATQGKIAWIWDDGDIDELEQFGDHEPYSKPDWRPEENI